MPECQKCKTWGVGFKEYCNKCRSAMRKEKVEKPVEINQDDCEHEWSGWTADEKTGQPFIKCYKCNLIN